MQRFYVLFSATLLSAFIALIALKVDAGILEQASVTIEEIDLEDKQGETEEIQFQLKDFNHHSSEDLAKTTNANILVNYHFAIKSNCQKVSSPPPKA
ncbi:MAG: hypothetical protein P8P74_14345 [Crocinitomicaceae bacterium]|nr:hypothetical protein [Crocinitomicaceae bacterium]